MRYIHSDRISLSPTRIPSTTGYHLLPLRGSGKNSQNPAEAVVLLLRVRRCLPFSLEAFGPLLQDAPRCLFTPQLSGQFEDALFNRVPPR
jgi:hypothetical protein